MPTPPPRHPVRSDIQALRTVAVGAVVLFHIWPGVVRGGYVGVDVFLVISGYLITAQLLNRIERRGSIGLADFWARRVRRLLPASLFVLLVSTGLTAWIAFPQDRPVFYRSIAGSALYVQNWVLAADAVDYLRAHDVPPIAQHYWSLSVEEQFYVAWPLLLIFGTAVLARVLGMRALPLLIGTVGVVSFIAGVLVLERNPSYGYFATPLRIWEFAAGGILAVAGSKVRLNLLWAIPGWLLIAAASLLYTEQTKFPGYAALIPVAGATLVIAARADPASSPLLRWTGWRPVQWIGDQSYGIYLWHWPLVVMRPAVLGRPAELHENVVILVLTVAIAALCKRVIEDPVRFSGRLDGVRPATMLTASVLAVCLIAASALVPNELANRRNAAREREVAAAIAEGGNCIGAAVMLSPACSHQLEAEWHRNDLAPTWEGLLGDTGGAYGCYSSEPSSELPLCSFGSEAPDALRILLTGDSHAAMLVPMMHSIADSARWSVTTSVARGCVWGSGDLNSQCADYENALTDEVVSGGHDVVVIAAWNNTYAHPDTASETANAYAATWTTALGRGISVVVVADNPHVTPGAAECMRTARVFALQTCAMSKDEAVPPVDPLRMAARATGASVVDLSDAYCRDDLCPVVAGGVILYRDEHHLTATYSRSLGPFFRARFESLVN